MVQPLHRLDNHVRHITGKVVPLFLKTLGPGKAMEKDITS